VHKKQLQEGAAFTRCVSWLSLGSNQPVWVKLGADCTGLEVRAHSLRQCHAHGRRHTAVGDAGECGRQACGLRGSHLSEHQVPSGLSRTLSRREWDVISDHVARPRCDFRVGLGLVRP
jgi:hypothetical protein